jgi:hypothetical protein
VYVWGRGTQWALGLGAATKHVTRPLALPCTGDVKAVLQAAGAQGGGGGGGGGGCVLLVAAGAAASALLRCVCVCVIVCVFVYAALSY